MSDFLIFVGLSLFFCLLISARYYPIRRERIEATCIEESKIKTFMDEFITNLLIMIPIYATGFVIFTIVGIFE